MSDIKEKIVSEIKKIYDPEIPINIYELGLIYKIEVNEQKKVNIDKVVGQFCLMVKDCVEQQYKLQKRKGLNYVFYVKQSKKTYQT